MIPLNRPLLCCSALAWLPIGCAGGQTGEETPGRCVETTSTLQPDELSPLGFSPRAVLSTVGETANATLRWLPNLEFAYGPERGESTLTFQIVSIESTRYVDSEVPGTDGLALLPICQDRVEVAARVSVSTAGGALAEQFDATLMADSPNDVWLSRLFEPGDVAGAFTVDAQSLGANRFVRFTFEAHWSADGVRGLLAVGLERASGSGADSSVSFRNVDVACFSNAGDPTAGCTPVP